LDDIQCRKEELTVEVSEIRIRMVENDSKMKAVVSVTFDDVFVVHDIKVIEGTKGIFIAMPSRRSPDGVYRDIVHPINTEFRDSLVKRIVSKFEQEKELQEIPPLP
jgi:stage V sporulation protein G